MITWEILGDNGDGVMVYKRIDEDGLVRVTAIKGYPELDEYLASLEEPNLPEVKETPETSEAE
jgi:cobalamin biosynthesis Co2+ chelatase CbiK